LGAITAPNVMRMGSKPLPDTANQVAGVFRSARAMAIAQTSPIKVKPAQRTVNTDGTSTGGLDNQLEVWRASNNSTACNSETGWTRINHSLVSGSLDFAKGVKLAGTRVDGAVLSVPTGWEVCFNTRGVASTRRIKSNSFQGSNIVLTLEKTSDSSTQRLEIFSTGGVQVYDN
jgi:hypothetical protein